MSLGVIHALLAGRVPANGRHFVVAIDGRGGSGKSTLLECIVEVEPEWVMCAGDDYFEPVSGQLAWGAFNDERFVRDVLGPVSVGRSSFQPRPWVWAEERIVECDPVEVPAGGVFVLERCFSFALPVTWDLKIWVETPREVCLERGTERDVFPDDRGRRVWEQVWQPREDAYIVEQRPQEAADLILDGTRPWSDQLVRSS